MKTFNEFLAEATDKGTVVAAFGRFNPPTIGHQKLMDSLVKIGNIEKAGQVRVYGSKSQDPKKNPLDFQSKMKYLGYMTKMAPVKVMSKSNIKTPFEMVEELAKEGFTKIIVVAGSDRIAEYQRAEKYALENGAEEYKVMSAGDRDPDAEGASGMSASKMRKAAADGDFESFMHGVGADRDMATAMYNDVRKGMGIK